MFRGFPPQFRLTPNLNGVTGVGYNFPVFQKLARSYPPQFEFIGIFLLLLSFYLAWSYYPQLPDRIPTHFNFAGVPDGWGGRGSIFIYPVLGAAIYLFLTALNIAFSLVEDPRKMINLPANRKAALSREQIETLRIFINRSLFVLKLLIQGLMLYSVYITFEVALGRAGALGSLWYVFIAAILIFAMYLTIQSYRLTSTKAS